MFRIEHTHGSRSSALCVIAKHYNDVIMSAVASQITSVSIACTNVGSGADQRTHKSSDGRWIPRTKGQWRGKCFHLMTSSWSQSSRQLLVIMTSPFIFTVTRKGSWHALNLHVLSLMILLMILLRIHSSGIALSVRLNADKASRRIKLTFEVSWPSEPKYFKAVIDGPFT